MPLQFDEEAFLRDVHQQVQPQLNADVQDVVRSVRDRMEGQPEQAIYDTLLSDLADRFGDSYTPNHEELHKIAESIHTRTLTG